MFENTIAEDREGTQRRAAIFVILLALVGIVVYVAYSVITSFKGFSGVLM